MTTLLMLDPLAEAAQKAQLSEASLRALRVWMAELLVANEYAGLKQGGHTQADVPLQQIFVDLPVSNAAHQQGERRLFLQDFLKREPVCLKRSEVGPVVETPAAVLLIGGPGQGKSTLGQLACQLHRVALLGAYASELSMRERHVLKSFQPQPSSNMQVLGLSIPEKPMLPLHIALPEFSSWLARDKQQTPDLLKFICSLPSAKKSNLRESDILAIAKELPVFIVLDGFDEVGSVRDRQDIVDAARSLREALGEAKGAWLMTTRPQGYAGELSAIDLSLKECYLVPLQTEEALVYARKLVEVKIAGVDQQQKTLDRLEEAAQKPATARLLSTPLQVTILTALVQQGRAPSERWRLFSNYFKYTYDREIERDSYASELLSEHRSKIEAIHLRVALILQVEAEQEGGIGLSRDALMGVIRTVLEEDGIEGEAQNQLAADILKACSERLVFLVEPEAERFGFEIRSLQEFMAAWAISQGSDADIKARLQQIVGAAMFRNVLLFVSSRLYSESSHLRGYWVELCEALDGVEDGSKQTRAGALLALDTLEEGAVLNQPRYAAALLACAVKLLELPPDWLHVRLVIVVNDDFSAPLQEAIERGLRRGDMAAWVCLIAATYQKTWARDLLEAYWEQAPTVHQLLDVCSDIGLLWGEWMIYYLSRKPDGLSAEDIVYMIGVQKIQLTHAEGWLLWFGNTLNAHDRQDPRKINLCLSVADVEEPAISPLSAWMPLVLVGRFACEPSLEGLAIALESCAQCLNQEVWESLANYVVWPVAACLRSAENPQMLIGFAEQLRRGELGDVALWHQVEERWAALFSLQKMPTMNFGSVPWSVDGLQAGAPLMVLPKGFLLFTPSRWQKPEDFLTTAIVAFQETSSLPLKRRLSEVCFKILRNFYLDNRVPYSVMEQYAKVNPQKFNNYVLDRQMQAQELLSLTNINSGISSYTSIVVAALISSKGDKFLLYCSVFTIVYWVNFYSNMHEPEPNHDRQELLKTLDSITPNTPLEHAEIAVLRLWIGDFSDPMPLLNLIAQAAPAQNWLWKSTLYAIEEGAKPSLSSLLWVYQQMGPQHPSANIAIAFLRKRLQKSVSFLENPSIWDRLGLSFPRPKPRNNEKQFRHIPEHPIVLSSLELKDVRGISALSLTFNAPPETQGQWIFILGPNGVGKTTLLRSIVLGLRNCSDPSIWPEDVFGGTWQRLGSKEATIHIQIQGYPTTQTSIRSNGSLRITQHPEPEQARPFPLFAYGCRRGSALGGTAREVKLLDNNGPEIATLFSEGKDLIQAETWLLILAGDANPRSQKMLEAICQALTALLDIKNISIFDRRVWITEKNGQTLTLDAMSDGYLTTAGWFLDLIARWLALADQDQMPLDQNFLKYMRGLVLIDEIDLHLHPRWQMDVVSRTRKLMPQMSFVVTTHNPLTLVGARPEEIWILSRDATGIRAETGREMPMVLSGGQIYRQYFGIEDIFPKQIGRDMSRYGFLSSYAERSDAEQEELEEIQTRLKEAGVLPEWEIVPRLPAETLP